MSKIIELESRVAELEAELRKEKKRKADEEHKKARDAWYEAQKNSGDPPSMY